MRITNLYTLYDKEDHLMDSYRGLGYQYEHNLLNKVISSELFGNPVNDIPLRQIERLIEELINQVKRIKKSFAFALDKHSKKVN